LPWLRLGATSLTRPSERVSALALDAGVRLGAGLRLGTRVEWTGAATSAGEASGGLVGLGVGGWWSPDWRLAPWVGVRLVGAQPIEATAEHGVRAHLASEAGVALQASDSLALLLTVEGRTPLLEALDASEVQARTTGAGVSLRLDF
jgi:hypothetical protein